MVSEPRLLLCDEVTSGLDPKAEERSGAAPAPRIAKREARTVISVTHSLRHLELHDTVTVLYEGRLVFQGPPRFVRRLFRDRRIRSSSSRPGHAAGGRMAGALAKPCASSTSAGDDAPNEIRLRPTEDFRHAGFSRRSSSTSAPAPLAPFLRNRGQLALQLALLFGFPCLVVIFAWGGLPQIQNLSGHPSNALQQLLETTAFALRSSRVGSLVSGLVMFQVILLTLMGSNNAAREIAGRARDFREGKIRRAASGQLHREQGRFPQRADRRRSRSGWDFSSA